MEPDNVKTFEDGSITIKFKKLVGSKEKKCNFDNFF